MKIIDYRFGRLGIEGRSFENDLLIAPNQVYPDWWRKEGHKLQWADIDKVIEETEPDILIVGRGKFGMMTVQPDVIDELNRKKIEIIASKTPKAIREFNKLVNQKNVLGAFHLTC